MWSLLGIQKRKRRNLYLERSGNVILSKKAVRLICQFSKKRREERQK